MKTRKTKKSPIASCIDNQTRKKIGETFHHFFKENFKYNKEWWYRTKYNKEWEQIHQPKFNDFISLFENFNYTKPRYVKSTRALIKKLKDEEFQYQVVCEIQSLFEEILLPKITNNLSSKLYKTKNNECLGLG